MISVRVQKWIWSPTPRHNTPPLTVFINSHHCLADANQLPSEPCERVFLIGIAKKWACTEHSPSFHESFLRISAGHSARWQFSLPLISTSITKIAFLECFQFYSIQFYILRNIFYDYELISDVITQLFSRGKIKLRRIMQTEFFYTTHVYR